MEFVPDESKSSICAILLEALAALACQVGFTQLTRHPTAKLVA